MAEDCTITTARFAYLPVPLPHPELSDNASHTTQIHAVESHTDRVVFVRFSANARNTRLAAVGTIAILLIVGYISLLRYFRVSEMPVERDLGLKNAVGPIPSNLYRADQYRRAQ